MDKFSSYRVLWVSIDGISGSRENVGGLLRRGSGKNES
jgi:hypothetical protein